MIKRNLKQFCFINFIAKHKILTVILFSLIIICTVIFAIFYDDIRNFYCSCYHNNPVATISVVLTLLVPIAKAIFSLIKNAYVQKAANAISLKNEVYDPLLRELNTNHEILENNPCPPSINFEKKGQTHVKHPQYIVWGEIEKDSRKFKVPSELNTAMEELYKEIEKYKKTREPALEVLSRIYFNDKIIQQLINDGKMPMCNFESLLSGVLLNKRPENSELIKNCPNIPNISILDALWDNIIKMAEISSILQECKEARSRWHTAEKEAIDLLEKLNQDIVNKYEK